MACGAARFALATVPAILAIGALAGPARPSDEQSVMPRSCEIRVVHRGQAVAGVLVSLLAEGVAPAVHRADEAATTDFSGRATVPIESRLTTLTPYLERRSERLGWSLFVLAPIDASENPNFCRGPEVIELPDTLVRVEVTETGRPIAGAFVGLDNVGVRLGGDAPPRRGIVSMKAETGFDGVVEIPGLAPGSWRIVASTLQRERFAERQISLGEGMHVEVDLLLESSEGPPLPDDRRDSSNGSGP